jgi:hypothetical protein
MKNIQDINREVDKVLDSLDGSVKASPRPFFYTRVMARLQQDERLFWNKALIFLSRPSIAIATIFLAIGINAFVFYDSRREPSQPTAEEEQVFASDYNLANNSIYDTSVEP